MDRFQGILILLLMASALSLVSSQHQGRSLFVELERARTQARRLDVDWRRLQLDVSNVSKQAVIETVARRDLHLSPMTPSRTLYLSVDSKRVAVQSNSIDPADAAESTEAVQ